VLTRAACPGLQRYAQTWSGDNTSSWHTLRWNLPMGLGLSLSGMPNTGHDVGGFFGDPPDPELFVRWVEAGVFQPRFSIHSVGLTGLAPDPWMYPEVLPIIRDWIRFRYRLIPYLYTLLFESARTGQPITRPLVYAFPDDPRCQTESFEFLLGPGLLVVPVTEPGARHWPVYLPAGTDWCDFHTGNWHPGGQTIEVAAPLERIPLFAPTGALIPNGKPMRHVGAEPDDVREILTFPHPEACSGTFTLIEDDGVSTEIDYTKVSLRMDATPKAIRLAVEVVGTYPCLTGDRVHPAPRRARPVDQPVRQRDPRPRRAAQDRDPSALTRHTQQKTGTPRGVPLDSPRQQSRQPETTARSWLCRSSPGSPDPAGAGSRQRPAQVFGFIPDRQDCRAAWLWIRLNSIRLIPVSSVHPPIPTSTCCVCEACSNSVITPACPAPPIIRGSISTVGITISLAGMAKI
jgi:hypothetical protein